MWPSPNIGYFLRYFLLQWWWCTMWQSPHSVHSCIWHIGTQNYDACYKTRSYWMRLNIIWALSDSIPLWGIESSEQSDRLSFHMTCCRSCLWHLATKTQIISDISHLWSAVYETHTYMRIHTPIYIVQPYCAFTHTCIDVLWNNGSLGTDT